MFAERLDALMCIAGVTNSLLGRAVNIDSTHIGRLRNGVRPLPKKHDYLASICQYLAAHITQAYQISALQELTGISTDSLSSKDSIALYLQHWLSEQEQDITPSTCRVSQNFSHSPAETESPHSMNTANQLSSHAATYLYGNAGKRKAVEQFFLMVLQEKKPQTLLLFSDENMAWLYEDLAFAKHWSTLFTKVILKGNRVRIIHTLSRDLNELMEAILKWLPIYMTGAIEPYYYPKIKDGVFQHTLFIAPHTAAISSSSITQHTNDMLNLFLTDHAAISALMKAYEQYLNLCRPLMFIFTSHEAAECQQVIDTLNTVEGNALLLGNMLPLFAMPETLIKELTKLTANEILLPIWEKSISNFHTHIKKHRLSLMIPDPDLILLTQVNLLSLSNLFGIRDIIYSQSQYLLHYEHLMKLKNQYENLNITIKNHTIPDMLLYAKEDAAVIMIKTRPPISVFLIREPTMINAIWNYMKITIDGPHK